MQKFRDAILVKEKKELELDNHLLLILLAAVVSGGMFIFNQYPGITIALAAMLTFGLFLLSTLRKKRIKLCCALSYTYLISFMLLVMSLKLWFVFFEGHTMLLIGLLDVELCALDICWTMIKIALFYDFWCCRTIVNYRISSSFHFEFNWL